MCDLACSPVKLRCQSALMNAISVNQYQWMNWSNEINELSIINHGFELQCPHMVTQFRRSGRCGNGIISIANDSAFVYCSIAPRNGSPNGDS